MAEEVKIRITAEDSFSGVLSNFGNIITGIRSAISLAGDAFRAFTDFALEGFEAIGQYERLTATMETLVAKEILAAGGAETMAEALALSGEKAESLLHWVQQLAIESPFSQEGVANAFRTALAYGFTADEAQRLTEAMINFAAGSGATEGAMSQIALALGQIQAKGKLAGQEVLQLVNAGLPVNEILAEAFNVTTAEIVEMREKGLIPAGEAIEAITSYLETNFEGAAKRQAETWTGLKNTFEDIKAIGLREFFGGLSEVLKPVLVDLSDFLQGPGLEAIGAIGEVLGQMAGTVLEGFAGFSESPLMLWLIDLIERSTVVTQTLTGIREGLADLEEFGTLGPVFEISESIDTELFKENLKNDIKDALYEAFVETDWGIVSDQIVQAIDNVDWTSVGASFSDGLMTALGLTGEQIGEVDWFALLFAPIKAAGEFLAGWFASFWNIEVSSSLEEAIDQWRGFFYGFEVFMDNWTADLWADIVAGLKDGWESAKIIMMNTFLSPFKLAIQAVKDLFGIASPSTVFMGIGRDLIFGLITGIASMITPMLTFINALIDMLLAPFQPIIDIISNLVGGGDVIGTSDTIPSDGGGTGGGTPGQVINNYFYGPSYFGVDPDAPIRYDCPSPNPIMNAGSGFITP